MFSLTQILKQFILPGLGNIVLGFLAILAGASLVFIFLAFSGILSRYFCPGTGHYHNVVGSILSVLTILFVSHALGSNIKKKQ